MAVWGLSQYFSVKEAPGNIESSRVSREETFCFFENWMPERGSNPRPLIFEAGSFNHCTRATAPPMDLRPLYIFWVFLRMLKVETYRTAGTRRSYLLLVKAFCFQQHDLYAIFVLSHKHIFEAWASLESAGDSASTRDRGSMPIKKTAQAGQWLSPRFWRPFQTRANLRPVSGWASSGRNRPGGYSICLIPDGNVMLLYCPAKPKGSICLLVKQADTAFWLYAAL